MALTQAMVFSAGLGTRFKPWTDKHPKALGLVNGKSLLQRNIEYLQQFGINDVVVNVHHFAEQVEDAIINSDGWGSNILISDERSKLLDTGGGLQQARELFEAGKRFLTCNVDILTNLDITRLLGFHEETKALITLSVTQRTTSRYLLFDKENRLCGWRNEKTKEEKIAIPGNNFTAKAYSCVVVFEPAVFDLIRLEEKFSLIDLYLDLAADHLIMGYDHTGDQWVDVGKPESVETAEKLFR